MLAFCSIDTSTFTLHQINVSNIQAAPDFMRINLIPLAAAKSPRKMANDHHSSTPVDVFVHTTRYLTKIDQPWTVAYHRGLVFAGCRIRLHALGTRAIHEVNLGGVADITPVQVVFRIHNRPIGCPLYITFPRSLESSLQWPQKSWERQGIFEDV